jgi:hypothetical protein
MIAESTTNRTEYRFPLLKLVMTYLLAPLLSIVSLGSGAFLLKSDGLLIGSLMILFGVFFMLVGAYGSLLCSSIVVADEGITARNFGKPLKVIHSLGKHHES